MERLEVITVVLLGVGALLIANPVYLGAQEAQGSVVIAAAPQDPTVEDLPTLAAESEAATYDPNVTRWQTLTAPEHDLIDRALDEGGAIRISREQYQGTYRNASTIDYLRPGGFLYRNGSLYRPRFSRAQRGLGFTIQEPTDSILVADAETLPPERASTASDSTDAPVPLDDARVLSSYDYVIVENTLYAPAISGGVGNGSKEDSMEAENVTGNETSADGGTDRDGAMLRLERREPTVLYDALSVNAADIPRPQRGQLEHAIDNGSYDTGNTSVGALSQIPMVRSDGSYYTLSFDTASPGVMDVFDTINILGFLMGLVFIASGLYYAREVHRIRTAEWEA